MKLAVLSLIVLAVFTTTPAPAASGKKLIEFGWDEPDTRFMREHIAEMEQTPFDGCVFHVDARRSNGSKRRFTWEGWGTNAFTEAELRGAIDDLRATRFQRFTHNFLRFNTTPATLDWFDDYRAVVTNCYWAAMVARQGGVKGVLFDIEQYEGQLFDYRRQRATNAMNWEAYARQVRRRGREIMQAFQAGYPGLTIFLTFGYSLPWNESGFGQAPLARCHYGLLAPFLDGMLDVAEPATVLVDGNESSYGYRDTNRITRSYAAMHADLLPIVAAPERYERHFSFGFGLWLDYDWRKRGWNTNDLSKNFYTPEMFERSTRVALRTADEYVWVYTEQARWWSEKGGSVKLPSPYADALRRAKQAANRR